MMELMKKEGKVIWINADINTVLDRCKNDTDRPLLKLPKEELFKLFEKRKEVYSLADIRIDSDEKTPLQIVSEIVNKL